MFKTFFATLPINILIMEPNPKRYAYGVERRRSVQNVVIVTALEVHALRRSRMLRKSDIKEGRVEEEREATWTEVKGWSCGENKDK